MVAFGHTAIGTITGITAFEILKESNPLIGIPIALGAGIVSHYLTDFIPHGHFFQYHEYKNKVKYAIIFDFAFSVFLFTLIPFLQQGINQRLIYIISGIAGSQLPDILDGLIHTKFLKPKGLINLEYKFHQLMHWHGNLEKALLWGKRDLWQVLIIVLALFLLFKFS